MANRRALRFVAGSVAAGWIWIALPMSGLSFVLLIHAETLAGRLAACCALVVVPLPFVVFAAISSRRWRIIAGADAAIAATLLIVVAAMSPDGRALPGSRVESRFPGPGHFRRYRAGNLVPEIDQIKLGTYVIAWIDSIIDDAAAVRLRQLSLGIYRAMEADPEFRALGSVMPDAYGNRDTGHLYVYVPEHAPGERLPALVFLHGSAGNFKSYFWLWRRFADKNRVIVACPSFGFGNWFRPGGTEAVERARTWVVASLPVDPGRVYLAGLSNGGTGVTRAASAHPERWAGLILLSAVVEPRIISGDSFIHGWTGRRVLMIHGSDDDRIPRKDADEAAESLRKSGIDLTYQVYDHEDHFLLFSQADPVLDEVGTWIVSD